MANAACFMQYPLQESRLKLDGGTGISSTHSLSATRPRVGAGDLAPAYDDYLPTYLSR
jgi:hypothetical protein